MPILICKGLMRKSPQRHPMAVLRLILGLGQKEMATLLKCSKPTIQAIELGKLKISARLAHETVMQTGISLEWLLNSNAQEPPVNTWTGQYTADTFKQVQAELIRPRTDETDSDFIFDFYLECVSRLGGAMLSSIEANKYSPFRYKLRQLLKEIEDKFGTWPTLDEDLRTAIDVAMSEIPPYTPLVTDKIHNNLQKIIRQKQKQERILRRQKRKHL